MPQRGIDPQPKVGAPSAYLGVPLEINSTPTALRPTRGGNNPPQPRCGWRTYYDQCPRVDSVRQPWALGRNPVGIPGTSLPARGDFALIPRARVHGTRTCEPRQGRNAATAACSASAVGALALPFNSK